MTINLNNRSAHTSTTLGPVLAKLQGNILSGHGRDYTANVLVRFTAEAAALRAVLIPLAKRTVTSALVQENQRLERRKFQIPGGLFGSMLFTAAGYKKLGIDFATTFKAPDTHFLQGMRAVGEKEFGDPPVNQWEEAFQQDVDMLLLLADDDEQFLLRSVREVFDDLAAVAEVVGIEHGRALRDANSEGIEHFGYADGRSQPIFLNSDLEHEGTTDQWKPLEPLKLVLVQDASTQDEEAFGSYYVLRKLEQNVLGFRTREQELADALQLKGADRERAGAMAVGRYRDGTPLVLSATDGFLPVRENDFRFDGKNTSRCPLHAHIRKTNPRGDIPALLAPGSVEDEVERARRIARRGIPYGERRPSKGETLEELPTKDVGLLFACFQASIKEQFAFIQSSWVNAPDFAGDDVGQDPIIARPSSSPKDAQRWPTQWGKDGKELTFDFERFVTMKGASTSSLQVCPSSPSSHLDRSAASPETRRRGGSEHMSYTDKDYSRIRAINAVLEPRSEADQAYRAWTKQSTFAARLPATSLNDVIRRGGRIIERAISRNIFLGGESLWQQDAPLIDEAIGAALRDRRLENVVRQYFSKPISCEQGGAIHHPWNQTNTFTAGDTEALVVSLFDAGTIPDADLDSTIFNVLLPRGVVLSTSQKRANAQDASPGATSLGGLGGFHGSVNVVRHGVRKRLYYSVNVFSENVSGKRNGIPVFDEPWKNVVATLYHEVNEFRTDPDVAEANRAATDEEADELLGWISNSPDGMEEIGDHPLNGDKSIEKVIREIALASGAGSVPVQFLYSNAAHDAQGPAEQPVQSAAAQPAEGPHHGAAVAAAHGKKRYQPPANQPDFAESSSASELLASKWDEQIRGVVTADGDAFAAFFDPLSPPADADATLAKPSWPGFPGAARRLYSGTDTEIAAHVEEPIVLGDPDPLLDGSSPFLEATSNERFKDVWYRPQDEYLEWAVRRVGGELSEVFFTCEGPEYWELMGEHDSDLLVLLYRKLTGNDALEVESICFPRDVRQIVQTRNGPRAVLRKKGEYNPYNAINRDFAIHLTQRANTLGAEINLAKDASLLYGTPPKSTDPALVCCAGYGAPNRNSDPTIGAAVNNAVRSLKKKVSLVDPIGLYIRDWRWDQITCDGKPFPDAKKLFDVVRGKESEQRVLRLHFRVPAGLVFEGSQVTVARLAIGGDPITMGGQLATLINIHLFAMTAPGAPEQESQPCSGKPCFAKGHPQFVVSIGPNSTCPPKGVPLGPIGAAIAASHEEITAADEGFRPRAQRARIRTEGHDE